jgi:DNA-cytosine methyltransferase
MNVLSLFDGISCAQVALGDRVNRYYASEIDPQAIKIAKKNFPSTIHLGDVKSIKENTIEDKIDILIGGSPCTDLSIAKKGRKGLEGEHSKLFWEYVRLKKIYKPTWFILENVASMQQKDKDIISKELGVEPIMINASLVSAQSRKRLFWTNIPNVGLPEDRQIKLKDILEAEDTIDTSYFVKNPTFTATVQKDNSVANKLTQIGFFGATNACKVGGQALRIYSSVHKSATSGIGYYKVIDSIRRLTPKECERLQSLPDNYTEGISKTARYKALGNAFNVEVIKHILYFLPG